MLPSPSERFRRLLDLARLGIEIRDGGLDAVSSAGRRIAPARAWRHIEVPAIGEPVCIPSENRNLEAWQVVPDRPATASVLIFHGIGDRITYWRRLQQRLAESGFASLVFHYSGYGASGGKTTPDNLAADAHAAYAWLRSRTPQDKPVFAMGFSLGSGLLAQVAANLDPPPAGIILCEAFSTLRLAAGCVVRPLTAVASIFPDVWRTRENVARLQTPLLVVHSSGDKLFPVAMAEEIHAAALAGGVRAELKVLDGYSHNAPYLLVPEDYWAAVVDFIERTSVTGPR